MSTLTFVLLALGFVAANIVPFLLLNRRARNPARRIARMTDPAEGTLVLTAAPAMSSEMTWQNCTLTGILSAQGVAPHAVQKDVKVPLSRRPSAGQALPVVVDRARPANWVIPRGRVARQDDGAFAEAERIVAAMRGSVDGRSPSE